MPGENQATLGHLQKQAKTAASRHRLHMQYMMSPLEIILGGLLAITLMLLGGELGLWFGSAGLIGVAWAVNGRRKVLVARAERRGQEATNV